MISVLFVKQCSSHLSCHHRSPIDSFIHSTSKPRASLLLLLASMQSPTAIRLCVNFAEGFEGDELVAAALDHKFSGGADEVDIAFLEVFLLGADADLAAAGCADDDRGAGDAFEGGFGFGTVKEGAHD